MASMRATCPRVPKPMSVETRDALFAIQQAAWRRLEAMLIELPNGKGKGKWSRLLIDEFGDHPRWSAMIRCPLCEERLSLVNHTISDDGQVSPSVGHPINTSCSWHVNPKLVGWAPCPPAPEPKPLLEPCGRCGTRGRQLGGWGIGWGFPLVCPKCIKELGGQ